MQDNTRQDKQYMTRQGTTTQYKTRKYHTIQYKTRQGMAMHAKPMPDKTSQYETIHKARQDTYNTIQ